MPQENKFTLSIIIPVFNEESYLSKLFTDIKIFFNKDSVEVIFINDGSYDNSKLILEDLKKKRKLFI